MNYKFGSKNNWRRWQWNQIVERLDRPAKDALVLYLPGEKDLDREVARRHGFQDQNLIAVENDTATLKRLRSGGRLVIQGDIFNVIASWPPSIRVDVIIADLCGGLTHRNWQLATLTACFESTRQSVFAYNLLRGRDAESNLMRELLIKGHREGELIPEHFRKHRGVHLFRMHQTSLIRLYQGWYPNLAQPEINQSVHTTCRPVFNSYRSQSGQIFDSVVFKSYFDLDWKLWDASPQQLIDLASETPGIGIEYIRPNISAILAHRTMGHGRVTA